MAGGELLTLLAMAVALAVQPWSVLAAVLLVTSPRGVAKEVAFVAGWMLALLAVAVLSAAFAPSTPKPSGPQPVNWVEVGLGVALAVYVALRLRRPRLAEAKEPGWMRRVDTMPLPVAFVLGGFLPNYLFVVAAAGEILQLHTSTAAALGMAVVFVVIASLGVAAPLGVLLVDRKGAPARFTIWRAWLVANNQAVMAGVGLLIALMLVGKGIAGLTS